MTFWHRAITILLVMVFTPAAVLAGTSLCYCMGSDSHVVNSAHHKAEVLDGFTQARMAQSGGTDCSGSPLLSGYQSARAEQARAKEALSELPSVLALAPALTQAAASFLRSDDVFARAARTDPRLRTRKTTVLLV